MHLKTISSPYTFLLKVIAPTVPLFLYCYLMELCFWHFNFGWVTSSIRGSGPWQTDDQSDGFGFTVAFCVAFTGFIWAWGGLKRVRIDGDGLLVSNYLIEREISFDQIAEVRQGRWFFLRSWNWTITHPVIIIFKDRTVFGKRIEFMPEPTHLRVNPIVHELRALAGIGR